MSAGCEVLTKKQEDKTACLVFSDTEISQDQILTSLIPSAVLAHCNVKQDTALARTFGLEDQSALLIFRQRIILYVDKGFHDTEKVSYLMQQISMLDMDKIRQNIEQEKAAEALHMRRACPISRGKMI